MTLTFGTIPEKSDSYLERTPEGGRKMEFASSYSDASETGTCHRILT